MTSCTGCNVSLGWKKYNFQKQWRVHGYFCKDCMKKIGQDFDDHGKITLPKRTCDSCHQELYFLESVWHGKKQKHCCSICQGAGYIETPTGDGLPPVPPRVPIMMAIFAAFGILLMITGFAYVLLVAPQQESNILHIIIGSSMTGAGFMLARKMVKVRNLVLGKINIPKNSESLR